MPTPPSTINAPEVQLFADGSYGLHPSDEVFACRDQPGGISCTTVSGRSFKVRLEFDEVRPVWGIPKNLLAAFSSWVPPAWEKQKAPRRWPSFCLMMRVISFESI